MVRRPGPCSTRSGRRERCRRRDEDGHLDRPPGDVTVDGLLEDALEVLERERVDDLAREGVRVPERREEQDEQRAEVDDQQPRERQREERGEPHARMPEEERREPPPRGTPGRRLDVRSRAQRISPLISVQAAFQSSCVLQVVASSSSPQSSDGRRPVVDVLPTMSSSSAWYSSQWFVVLRQFTRLEVDRCLAEALGHRCLRLRRDHVIHPEVHAVRVRGLASRSSTCPTSPSCPPSA